MSRCACQREEMKQRTSPSLFPYLHPCQLFLLRCVTEEGENKTGSEKNELFEYRAQHVEGGAREAAELARSAVAGDAETR